MDYFNSILGYNDNGIIVIKIKKDIKVSEFIDFCEEKYGYDLKVIRHYLFYLYDTIKTGIWFKLYIDDDKFYLEEHAERMISLIKCSENHSSAVLINKETEEYFYYENGDFILDEEKLYIKVSRLVRDIASKFDRNNVVSNAIMYLSYINLYDDVRKRVVFRNDEIFLALPTFYKEDFKWMKLDIVDVKTHNVVGVIEFNLKTLDEDNFSYTGNVSYEIKNKFRNMGYATKALALIKDYISSCAHEYNKVLYISTMIDNYYSQQVAVANDAQLYYEGVVPKGDRLNTLGKVKEVKIYVIDNL